MVPRILALAKQHQKLGASFGPFGEWEMPIQYGGTVKEHRGACEKAGVFDASHMGRLFVTGRDAARVLRSTYTYNVMGMAEGVGRYALLCAEDGGILDDLFIYRLGPDRFLVVHNAANSRIGEESIIKSAEEHRAVGIQDVQSSTVMLPVQGPKAKNILLGVLGEGRWTNLGRRECVETTCPVGSEDSSIVIARTGYTGISGYELITSVAAGRILLQRLVDEGAIPCGLGARDTLRLEAALHLHGNDINAITNPWEAGLGFAVSLEDGVDFTGRDALVAAEERPD